MNCWMLAELLIQAFLLRWSPADSGFFWFPTDHFFDISSLFWFLIVFSLNRYSNTGFHGALMRLTIGINYNENLQIFFFNCLCTYKLWKCGCTGVAGTVVDIEQILSPPLIVKYHLFKKSSIASSLIIYFFYLSFCYLPFFICFHCIFSTSLCCLFSYFRRSY